MARMSLRHLLWIEVVCSSIFLYLASGHLGHDAEYGCTPLRILPVGDSITEGRLSSTGNGYRAALQSMLLGDDGVVGADVDFVGPMQDGNMTDNDNDGHSGAFLADIPAFLNISIGVSPNVVLVYAGTNDMDKNVHISTAIDRMEAIIRTAASGAPQAAILVGQLFTSNSVLENERTAVFNAQIPPLVERLTSLPDNLNVMVVDLSDKLTSKDLTDKKHPNDAGYTKMAAGWAEGIANATRAGMIRPANRPTTSGKSGLGVNGSQPEGRWTCLRTAMKTSSATTMGNSAAHIAKSITPFVLLSLIFAG